MSTPRDIRPAEGKLGILCVGLGAVTSTLIAGVELARRGLGDPIGSLTQMGTIRLGRRDESAGAAHQGLRPARRPRRPRLRRLGPVPRRRVRGRVASRGARDRPPRGARRRRAARGAPDAGGLRPCLREAHRRAQREGQHRQAGDARRHPRRHRGVPRRAPGRPHRHDLVRVDRDVHRAGARAPRPRVVRGRHRPQRPVDRAVDALRLRRAAGRHPVRQRRAQPHRRRARAARATRPSTACRSWARTSRPARRSSRRSSRRC